MPSIGYLCVSSFYSFIFLPSNCSPEKWCFAALKWPLLSQFSTYRHRTGFIVKRKQVRITNYSGLSINWYFFFKVAYFANKKKHALSKNLLKFIIHIFFKNLYGHTYICTKCIDNFKFTLSLKFTISLYISFAWVPPKPVYFL